MRPSYVRTSGSFYKQTLRQWINQPAVQEVDMFAVYPLNPIHSLRRFHQRGEDAGAAQFRFHADAARDRHGVDGRVGHAGTTRT
jgi:hypothetical protein